VYVLQMQIDWARKLFQARLGELLELFAIHDTDIGYCQGINELAAPFVHYFHDDAEAFWAFEALMRRLGRRNFRTDGAGIAAQLSSLEALLKRVDPPLHAHLAAIDAHNCYFVFRSLLVLLRRDYPFDAVRILLAGSSPGLHSRASRPQLDRVAVTSPPTLPAQAMTVWDVLLAEEDPNFILYVLGAVVVRSRSRLLECVTMDQAFEAMAKVLSSPPSLRGERWRALDVWRLIHHARALHDQ
jgi:hypothetical protein